MNTLDLAGHGPVIPVIVIDRVEDAVPLACALVAGGVTPEPGLAAAAKKNHITSVSTAIEVTARMRYCGSCG